MVKKQRNQFLWKWLSFVAAFGAFASIAYAGGRDGGGGVGFLCHEVSGDKVYLADTYQLVKSGKLQSYQSLDSGILFLAAGEQFAKVHPVPQHQKGDYLPGWYLIFKSSSLRWQSERQLPPLGDDHIVTIPQNCEKVQLAIQDVVNGIVRWDDRLVAMMTPLEIGLFQLHETFIALRGQPGQDTTPIRAAVFDVLDSPDFNFAKFIQGAMDPNTLLPVQKNIASYLPIIGRLPGEYSGQDQLKRSCRASVQKINETLEFSTTVEMPDHSEIKMASQPISISRLAQKFASDMDFIKRQTDYSASWMFVGYSTYSGLPSLFATYPNTNSIHVDWYNGDLSSIGVETEVSNGPFRDFNHSGEVTCYGLVRTK